MNKKTAGTLGEELASTILESQGFNIITKNYKTKYGEIDIIALKDKCLVFCEVKTRLSEKYGKGREAVTDIKKQHIWKTAQCFINNSDITCDYYEFHVIEIMISHIKDVNPRGNSYACHY